MKRISQLILLTLGLTSLAYAQEARPSPSPAPKSAMSNVQGQSTIIETEKKLWEAWKNKDLKPFRENLSEDSVLISESGVADKTAAIKDLESVPCEVRSHSQSDFKVTFLNNDTALLTYKATQDATCGGQPVPASVWASSVYVKRGGRWLAASHQETAAK